MVWWILGFVGGVFCLTILRGAPWLPTRRRELNAALTLLALPSGSRVVDLGSGSGGFLLAAARADLEVVGYEINPFLCAIAYMRTWRYRDRVRIVCSDYWLRPLPECQGVFVFLIDHFMPKLEQKLACEAAPGMRVVSYVFKLPSKQPTKTVNGLHLYIY